ncbi:hypothetical protein LPJ56_004488 [Coemansia sp. RSA 2599]|nr:hypothetical protein LPJ56_004488 [Coemansia sp. RSA 2599]
MSTSRLAWIAAIAVFYIHTLAVLALQLATIFTYHQYSTKHRLDFGNASAYLKALRYVNVFFALVAAASRWTVFKKDTYKMLPQNFFFQLLKNDIFMCAVSLGVFMDPATREVFDSKKGFVSAWNAFQLCIATMVVTLVAFPCSLSVFATRIQYDKHILKQEFESFDEPQQPKPKEEGKAAAAA